MVPSSAGRTAGEPGTQPSPSVACVIPTHCRPAQLRAALASVLAQDRDVDVVVVDDADDPATRDVVERCGSDRVVYVVNPAAGASSSRNLGARSTCTEVVAFLDDDDEWDPRYLSTALGAMARHGAEAVFTQIALGSVLPSRLDVRTVVAHNPGVTGSNIVLCREAFERTGGFDESLWVSNDKDFLVRFLDRGIPYAVVPEPLVHYRHHDQERLTEPSPRRLHALELYYARYRHRLRPTQRLFMLGAIHSTAARLSPSRAGRVAHRAVSLVLFACSPGAAVERMASRRLRTRRRARASAFPPGPPPLEGQPVALARLAELRQRQGGAAESLSAGSTGEHRRSA